jgi:hypothetical protein
VGDIVDRVFTMYRQRALLFAALASVPYLALFLILGGAAIGIGTSIGPLASFVGAVGVGEAVPEITPAIAGALAALLVFVLFGMLVAVLLLSVQIGSLVDAAAARHLGRETSVGASFRAGLRAAPKIIATGLLLLLALIVGWAVLIAVFVASRNGVVVALGVLLGLSATVYVLASWLVAPVVAAIEPVGPFGAVRRSWWLARGNRWRILGLQLLLAVLQVVLSTFVSFVFVIAFLGNDLARLVAQQVVNVIATILWAPVEWGTFTILYFDLRVRKEALDLQLAAEALPRQA